MTMLSMGKATINGPFQYRYVNVYQRDPEGRSHQLRQGTCFTEKRIRCPPQGQLRCDNFAKGRAMATSQPSSDQTLSVGGDGDWTAISLLDFYNCGPLPVISTYNLIYRIHNPIYNQL